MRRIRLTIEYDGTAYAGWQRQDNALAVQQVVEEAIARITGEKLSVTGASRTDAGVHALGQVAVFDTGSKIPADKFAFALNSCLPEDVRIRESEETAQDFHPRFHAKGKLYRYRVYASPHASAMERNFCAHCIYPLDIEAMRMEAQSMLGRKDFAAFAASGSVVKDTVREMLAVSVEGTAPNYEFRIYGTGFLYNMVRIFAGTLIGVGSGKLPHGSIERAIETKDRLMLGVTAPAQGLTLMRVDYTVPPVERMLL